MPPPFIPEILAHLTLHPPDTWDAIEHVIPPGEVEQAPEGGHVPEPQIHLFGNVPGALPVTLQPVRPHPPLKLAQRPQDCITTRRPDIRRVGPSRGAGISLMNWRIHRIRLAAASG